MQRLNTTAAGLSGLERRSFADFASRIWSGRAFGV
jgi:hypothetical protein